MDRPLDMLSDRSRQLSHKWYWQKEVYSISYCTDELKNDRDVVIVSEITNKLYQHSEEVQWEEKAIEAICCAAEAFMITLFDKSNRVAQASDRDVLFASDVNLTAEMLKYYYSLDEDERLSSPDHEESSNEWVSKREMTPSRKRKRFVRNFKSSKRRKQDGYNPKPLGKDKAKKALRKFNKKVRRELRKQVKREKQMKREKMIKREKMWVHIMVIYAIHS